MKAIALSICILFSASVFSQLTLNNYKYIIVPERFGFLKQDNLYGMNTLTKLLLKEKGFEAFLNNEGLPAEVATNKCNALFADVTSSSGVFVTKLTLTLKDCQGNIVFKSKEGKSREKEFQTAYDMALRDAYTSLEAVPYKYEAPVAVLQTQPAPVPATTTTATAPAPAPVQAPAPTTPSVTESTGVLYAQATPNGFQLIDTTPKKVLTLLKTSMQDYFISVDGNINGVVFKKNEEWMYEYYKNDKLVSQKLQIKF
ncbi:MAG: hypothetical protein ACTHMC_29300 [Pseudobacter sp.]|uniref:hypothetical protein n=1 Tax=Pseudobacter sp. TaxID=2045420 RepID=UPI003F7F8F76